MTLVPGTATNPSTTSADKHNAAKAIRTEESVTIFVNSFGVGLDIVSASVGMRQLLWARRLIDDDDDRNILIFWFFDEKEKKKGIQSV